MARGQDRVGVDQEAGAVTALPTLEEEQVADGPPREVVDLGAGDPHPLVAREEEGLGRAAHTSGRHRPRTAWVDGEPGNRAVRDDHVEKPGASCPEADGAPAVATTPGQQHCEHCSAPRRHRAFIPPPTRVHRVRREPTPSCPWRGGRTERRRRRAAGPRAVPATVAATGEPLPTEPIGRWPDSPRHKRGVGAGSDSALCGVNRQGPRAVPRSAGASRSSRSCSTSRWQGRGSEGHPHTRPAARTLNRTRVGDGRVRRRRRWC